MKKFFEELKRRNVIKAAIAYVVTAWLLIQVISTVLPPLGAPDWVISTITVLLVVGFPIWIIFAWVYEVTEEGIKRTSAISEGETIRPQTNKRLNILIVVMLAVAILVNLFTDSKGIALGLDGQDNGPVYEASIAVIPFDDMSSEGDMQWFCDGVADDILTHLSRLSDMKVISRTSTERYKNTDKSSPEITAELGVNYLVEGSVSVHEGAYILNVQLIDLNDRTVWAEIFKGEFKDILEIRERISKQIANNLKVTISPDEETALEKKPTSNMQAYELVVRARSLLNEDAVSNKDQIIKLLDRAIAFDPDYADAYAFKAQALLYAGFEHEKVSQELTEKALSIDPENQIAILNKVAVAWLERDFKKERDYLIKALAVNPNSSRAHLFWAMHFGNAESYDIDQALFHIHKAYELDPFSKEVVQRYFQILNHSEKYTQALELLHEHKAFWAESEFWYNGLLMRSKQLNDMTYLGAKLLEKVEENPENHYLFRKLAVYYDEVLNQNKDQLENARRAYQLQPTNIDNLYEFVSALSENRESDQFLKLIDSVDFKELAFKDSNLSSAWAEVADIYFKSYHQYCLGNYDLAYEIISSYTGIMKVYIQNLTLFILARSSNSNALKSHLKNYGISMRPEDWAVYYAIRGERDSLYLYLEKDEITQPGWINSRFELDPYRQDQRFQEFLLKNGFPATRNDDRADPDMISKSKLD